MPAALHAAVQVKLAESNNGTTGRARALVEPSLLAGKLFDEAGERLVPTHARKRERRYRYYVSASLLRPAAASRTAAAHRAAATTQTALFNPGIPLTAGWRLPAREIEQAVWAAAASLLRDPATLVPDMLAAGVPPDQLASALERLATLGAPHPANGAALQPGPGNLASAIKRVALSPDGMQLTIDSGIVTSTEQAGDATFILVGMVPYRVRRRGVEMRLVIDAPGAPTRDDAALLKVVARAHCWFADLVEGRAASVHVLAERLGVTTRYVQRLLPLAMLAPRLVEQIAAGQHPATLTVDRLTDHGPLPLRWAEQIDQLVD